MVTAILLAAAAAGGGAVDDEADDAVKALRPESLECTLPAVVGLAGGAAAVAAGAGPTVTLGAGCDGWSEICPRDEDE